MSYIKSHQRLFVMLFFVFAVALSFLRIRAEAAQSVVREIRSRDEPCSCSDIIDLVSSAIERIDKLSSDLVVIKGVVMSDTPEQLKKQADDIGEIKYLVSNFSCQAGLQDIESSVEDVANRTRVISESLLSHDARLRIHDQRFQNFTGEGNGVSFTSDCSDVRKLGFNESGVYRIKPNFTGEEFPLDIYCDFNTTGGDWLVFQRRTDGSVDFFRNWKNYSDGFGDLSGEFWLGNEILHQLTSNRKYKLRIEMADFENRKAFAEYSTFSVGPSSDYYRLRIGNFSGTAGDSLSYHNNKQFSTFDVDRDGSSMNCAQYYKGAWCFDNSHFSDLNGEYLGSRYASANGVRWHHWRNQWNSLKTAEMKIAPLN